MFFRRDYELVLPIMTSRAFAQDMGHAAGEDGGSICALLVVDDEISTAEQMIPFLRP